MEGDITLEQIGNDWLDPDFQYEGSVYDDMDWSYDYSTYNPDYLTYEPGPSLNVAWRDNPQTPTSQQVIAPYAQQTSWLDSLGDLFTKVAPTAAKIYELVTRPDVTIQQAPAPAAKSPSSSQPVIIAGGQQPAGSTQPIILFPGQGQQTGTSQPIFVQPANVTSGTPNYLLYVVIGLAAVFLLKRK